MSNQLNTIWRLFFSLICNQLNRIEIESKTNYIRLSFVFIAISFDSLIEICLNAANVIRIFASVGSNCCRAIPHAIPIFEPSKVLARWLAIIDFLLCFFAVIGRAVSHAVEILKAVQMGTFGFALLLALLRRYISWKILLRSTFSVKMIYSFHYL